MSFNPPPKSDSTKIEIIEVTHVVWVPLSPVHLRTKFKTLSEWLSNICEHKPPGKSIDEINFSYRMSSSYGYYVCLYGVNTYWEESGNVTRIDFEPFNLFFKPPKKGYQNLSEQLFKEKIIAELKEFIKTEKFKTSFLSKSNVICTNTGERISIK